MTEFFRLMFPFSFLSYMYANDKSRLLKIIAQDVTLSPTTEDTFQPIPGGPHQLAVLGLPGDWTAIYHHHAIR